MLTRIFPPQADNHYRGSRMAIWLAIPILLANIVMSINSIIIGRIVAQKADGLPLDTYSTTAADTVVLIFALWGLCHLMLFLSGILVLVRYRTMLPFVYVMFLADLLGRRLLALLHPIVRTGLHSNLPMNLVLLALMCVGLIFSLRTPRNRSRTVPAAI